MSCRYPPLADNAEDEARRHVRGLRRFYHHLLTYVLVNSGLATINLLTNPHHLWFIWPLLGWSLWLAIDALSTFARSRCLGRDWEEAKIRKLLQDRQ